jgi:hypothetical protein
MAHPKILALAALVVIVLIVAGYMYWKADFYTSKLNVKGTGSSAVPMATCSDYCAANMGADLPAKWVGATAKKATGLTSGKSFAVTDASMSEGLSCLCEKASAATKSSAGTAYTQTKASS